VRLELGQALGVAGRPFAQLRCPVVLPPGRAILLTKVRSPHLDAGFGLAFIGLVAAAVGLACRALPCGVGIGAVIRARAIVPVPVFVVLRLRGLFFGHALPLEHSLFAFSDQ
jgi:hypothetical protein